MAALGLLGVEGFEGRRAVDGGAVAHGYALSLLPRFELSFDGAALEVSIRSQRVIALLALERTRVRRSFVAGTLWPEVSDERASASLRSALWTLPRLGPAPIVAGGQYVALAADVAVDYYAACRAIDRLIRPAAGADEPDADPRSFDDALLRADLLAEWSEDWILVEQERYRQLRLHALEAHCDRLTIAGFSALAIQAGLAAVAAEPLRESAHRALVRAYVAEGNRSEALRQFRLYERLVGRELGIEPSAEFRALVEGVRSLARGVMPA